jgi:hypothetical protein
MPFKDGHRYFLNAIGSHRVLPTGNTGSIRGGMGYVMTFQKELIVHGNFFGVVV